MSGPESDDSTFPGFDVMVSISHGHNDAPRGRPRISLFDGKTLDGWIQVENNVTTLSAGSIVDPAAFTARLAQWQDPTRARLNPDALKRLLEGWMQSDPTEQRDTFEVLRRSPDEDRPVGYKLFS